MDTNKYTKGLLGIMPGIRDKILVGKDMTTVIVEAAVGSHIPIQAVAQAYLTMHGISDTLAALIEKDAAFYRYTKVVPFIHQTVPTSSTDSLTDTP